MSEIKLLQSQFKLAHDFTLRLVQELEEGWWNKTPEGLKTNINWQVGHIATVLYFQALVCTGGKREGIKEQIPLAEYIELYRMGSSPEERLEQKPGKEALLKALHVINQSVEALLDSISDEELQQAVAVKHPVANTKREVLVWCTHHQMWHNGQISMLKRVMLGKGL